MTRAREALPDAGAARDAGRRGVAAPGVGVQPLGESGAERSGEPGMPRHPRPRRVEHSRIPAFVDVPEYRGDTARTRRLSRARARSPSQSSSGRGPSASSSSRRSSPTACSSSGPSTGISTRSTPGPASARWRFPASGSVEAITGFASAADGVVVFPIAGGLQALDLATGRQALVRARDRRRDHRHRRRDRLQRGEGRTRLRPRPPDRARGLWSWVGTGAAHVCHGRWRDRLRLGRGRPGLRDLARDEDRSVAPPDDQPGRRSGRRTRCRLRQRARSTRARSTRSTDRPVELRWNYRPPSGLGDVARSDRRRRLLRGQRRRRHVRVPDRADRPATSGPSGTPRTPARS